MDPYKVLEISPTAGITEEDVRKAYKLMAKKWHPDRKLDDQEIATNRFKEIDAAYRMILSEMRKRRTDGDKRMSSSDSKSSMSVSSPSSPSSRVSHTGGPPLTRKQKLDNTRPSSSSKVSITLSPAQTQNTDTQPNSCPHSRTLIPEFNSSLARSVGISSQWTYTVQLSLSDLVRGKKLFLQVLQCQRSGKRYETVCLEIDIPPGSKPGTQIIFKSAGHEQADGTRQDIHFIVEEEEK